MVIKTRNVSLSVVFFSTDNFEPNIHNDHMQGSSISRRVLTIRAGAL